jgi:hypothetical protein
MQEVEIKDFEPSQALGVGSMNPRLGFASSSLQGLSCRVHLWACQQGPEFRKLTPSQLDDMLPRLTVLARSAPEDKFLLVTRLNGRNVPKDKVSDFTLFIFRWGLLRGLAHRSSFIPNWLSPQLHSDAKIILINAQ